MDSTIRLANDLSTPLAIVLDAPAERDPKHWARLNGEAIADAATPLLRMSRTSGIARGESILFAAAFTVAGIEARLRVRLTGTLIGSDIEIAVAAGEKASSWSSAGVALGFIGEDGASYRIAGAFRRHGIGYDDVEFSIARVILPQIDHVVVLMLENRSFDNVLGWLYEPGATPAHRIPSDSPARFDGLADGTYSNRSDRVDGGAAVFASRGTTAWPGPDGEIPAASVPLPDPGETFEHVARQTADGMGGFLDDYAAMIAASDDPTIDPRQIMQGFAPEQVPVISALARAFAVSDAWFASVPSETWPNRAFLQAGSSAGQANNWHLPRNIPTIFDVLNAQNIPWAVYNDGVLPSLTKTMFFEKYGDDEKHFGAIADFEAGCRDGTLPALTFLEPAFGPLEPDQSYHPPSDVTHGEMFLARLYKAMAASPKRDNVLFLVLFDEHGGTYDHVQPPGGAAPPEPYPVATDGTGFGFDRFGVRVPAIAVSSWITPGTVFRSGSGTPFDHTSLLATLRDWLGLRAAFREMLPSPRIAAAPTLEPVLDAKTPQPWPAMPKPNPVDASLAADHLPLNHIQRTTLVAAAARLVGLPFSKPAKRREMYEKMRTRGDAKRWREDG